MRNVSEKRLQKVLTARLCLHDAQFHLEKAGDRINGSIVSASFEEMSDIDRQRKIWDALEQEWGPDSTRMVGMLLAYTPDEWNIDLEGHHTNGHSHRRAKK